MRVAKLGELDSIGRQAQVIADIKVKRLLNSREQILQEIARRQNNPDISCQEIIAFMNGCPDPLAPDASKIKVLEMF